ncbi:MAG: hypothetical protein M3R61_11895 [Chloroflexota bacterium]|nr:hypothetical protein [Chloroflexota bacterium]
MSASATVDELYEQQIKPLSQADRLRLLALLAQDAVAIVQHEQAEPEKRPSPNGWREPTMWAGDCSKLLKR